MFVDQVTLTFSAGNGGNGSVSWARRKYVPKGGPSGGNGGDGGSILLCADEQLNSLEKLADLKEIKAEAGSVGGGEKSTGKRGSDLIVKVPTGVVARDFDTRELLADLAQNADEIILCRGGRGGRGNATFKSSTRRAPYLSTSGTKGESRRIQLELKSIADIGLVGFPNAGKSSLLNALTGARAEIGAFPFTTKTPNLGTFELPNHRKLIIADIPGIGVGAHINRGLGLLFLRHIERTRALIFVLDASGSDGRNPLDDYRVLLQELSHHNSQLLELPRAIALNKMDSTDAAQLAASFRASGVSKSLNVVNISTRNRPSLLHLIDSIIHLNV